MLMLPNSDTARKLTYHDFVKFPDDGKRHELVDGVHHVTPSPFTLHQRVVGNLYFLLRLHLETHGGGEVFVAPFDVVFTMFDVVEPDLLFVSDARRHIITDRQVKGSPDLVIEVLSSSTRLQDQGVKLHLYDRSDVSEYWLVDPDSETVQVYRRSNGRLVRAAHLRASTAVLESRLLAGVSLPLVEIFAGVR
jgi:Uma2 family endonuclease